MAGSARKTKRHAPDSIDKEWERIEPLCLEQGGQRLLSVIRLES